MSDPINQAPRSAQAGRQQPSFSPEDATAQALSETLRGSFWIVKALMAGLVALFFCSGVFVVHQDEVAVVLRFGKPVGVGKERLLQPGWHWALPYPVDEKVRIPIGKSHTATSTTGWYAIDPAAEARGEQPMEKGFLSPEADGYTLTADGNIIHVRATIKYRISDPLQYTFGFTNAAEVLTNVVNEAILYASSRTTADAALYKDKSAFRDLVIERVRLKAEQLGLGISLEPSDVETKVPVDVARAFLAVTTAEQDKTTAISTARGYYDQVTRLAAGEASALIGVGIASSNRFVQSVSAQAMAFHDQLPAYLANADLFRRRLMASTMQRVLTNAQVKFLLPEQFSELRLLLSKEPEAPISPGRQ